MTTSHTFWEAETNRLRDRVAELEAENKHLKEGDKRHYIIREGQSNKINELEAALAKVTQERDYWKDIHNPRTDGFKPEIQK